MSLSNVNIIRTDGALSRPPASNDGISGLIYYGTESSAGSTGLVYKINTPKDSEVFCSVSSKLRYHINRYFKWSQSPLYIYLINKTTTTFDEVVTLKDFSNGEIRLLGVLNDKANYSSTHVSALQTKAATCESEFAPLQIFYSARITGNVNALSTLKSGTAYRVSVNIAESLSGAAKDLKTAGASWVGSLGEMLGVKSASKVSDNIGWVEKYNLLDGEEWSEVGFVTGESLKNISLTLQNTLDGHGYTFTRKFVGLDGAYWNYSYTATSETSDFSTIENNTVYDKAFRNIRTVLLPKTNSPLKVDASGKLDFGVISIFKELGNQALQTMKDNDEISAFSFDIDENQNVLSTSKLQVVAKLVPIGVAKVIEVQLGFALSLSA